MNPELVTDLPTIPLAPTWQPGDYIETAAAFIAELEKLRKG